MHRRFHRRVTLLTAALAVAVAATAYGFGTVNRFGQHAEHERITRASLACGAAGAPGTCFQANSILNLAGGPGSFGGVGSPDSDEIFTPEAHCDDADFFAARSYPQSRATATAQLNACRTHLQGRFRQAVRAAAALLDSSGRLRADQVDLSSTCTFTGGFSGRAKCNVIEGFGRALHGVQDFYSHSNFADERDPSRPAGVNNPPGLATGGPAAGDEPARRGGRRPRGPLDRLLRADRLRLQRRVTHDTLNKDNGIIDPVSGAATGPTHGPRPRRHQLRPRGRRRDRRHAAPVERPLGRDHLHLRRAQGQPDDLRDRQGRPDQGLHGPARGDRRRLVGLQHRTDPGNLRITAAQAFNEQLISAAEAGPGQQPDLSAVVDFDTSARLLSSLADPPAAVFAGIDSEGGTDIGSGVSVAIGELTKDPAIDPKERSGIVVLTDGQDGGSSLPGALAQAADARDPRQLRLPLAAAGPVADGQGAHRPGAEHAAATA